MVFCVPEAVGAATAVGGGAATALGLGYSKETVDITRESFFMQMRQSKRLFTASFGQASYQHNESLAQNAQQHAESQALALASYYQAERMHGEASKLARDMDTRSFEMAWRTEARESLRDELANQYNRYNIIMLCNTVCLGSIYYFITVDGVTSGPASGDSNALVTFYVLAMGVAMSLFSISIFFCIIVTRRLHSQTAAVLERKLFANSEELQAMWLYQIENNLPTPTWEMMYRLNQEYQTWLAEHIHPLGRSSINLMYVGVLAIFMVAGMEITSRYRGLYGGLAIFWGIILLTVLLLVGVQSHEDRLEKTKMGCYDKSYLDLHDTETMNTMAKIEVATDALYSPVPVHIASPERREEFRTREEIERRRVAQSKTLQDKAERLQASKKRAKNKQAVLEALTTAAEELDALPEDLIARLNRIIYDVDILERETGRCLNLPSKYLNETMDDTDASEFDDKLEEQPYLKKSLQSCSSWMWSRRHSSLSAPPMAVEPIDAHRSKVSLLGLRRKLGQTCPFSVLIRIRNTSHEHLRLERGLKLLHGQYVKELDVLPIAGTARRLSLGIGGAGNGKRNYHLYPASQIPPRTEVTIAARSNGLAWLPTSGVEGELVYVNASHSWAIRIEFKVALANSGKCKVQATPVDKSLGLQKSLMLGRLSTRSTTHESGETWQAYHETIDGSSNYEVLVCVDKKSKLSSSMTRSPSRFYAGSLLRDTSSVVSGESQVSATALSASSMKTTPGSSPPLPARKNTRIAEDEDSAGADNTLIAGFLVVQEVGSEEGRGDDQVWHEKWCTLTPSTLTVHPKFNATHPDHEIRVSDVTKVQSVPDHMSNLFRNVFEIHYIAATSRSPSYESNQKEQSPTTRTTTTTLRLSANSSCGRNEWIRKISSARCAENAGHCETIKEEEPDFACIRSAATDNKTSNVAEQSPELVAMTARAEPSLSEEQLPPV